MIELAIVLAAILAALAGGTKLRKIRHQRALRRIAQLEEELGLTVPDEVKAAKARRFHGLSPLLDYVPTITDAYATDELPRPPDPPKKRELFKPPILDDDYFRAKALRDNTAWMHPGFHSGHSASYMAFGHRPSYYPPMRLVHGGSHIGGGSMSGYWVEDVG